MHDPADIRVIVEIVYRWIIEFDCKEGSCFRVVTYVFDMDALTKEMIAVLSINGISLDCTVEDVILIEWGFEARGVSGIHWRWVSELAIDEKIKALLNELRLQVFLRFSFAYKFFEKVDFLH